MIDELKNVFESIFPNWELIRESDRTAIYSNNLYVIKLVILQSGPKFCVESLDGTHVYQRGDLYEPYSSSIESIKEFVC